MGIDWHVSFGGKIKRQTGMVEVPMSQNDRLGTRSRAMTLRGRPASESGRQGWISTHEYQGPPDAPSR